MRILAVLHLRHYRDLTTIGIWIDIELCAYFDGAFRRLKFLDERQFEHGDDLVHSDDNAMCLRVGALPHLYCLLRITWIRQQEKEMQKSDASVRSYIYILDFNHSAYLFLVEWCKMTPVYQFYSLRYLLKRHMNLAFKLLIMKCGMACTLEDYLFMDTW